MSALYQMRYVGVAGQGHGCLYIGRNTIVGVDITGARYSGKYVEQDGRLAGTVELKSAGGQLVTGMVVPAGTAVPIKFDLPPNFGSGHSVLVHVSGRPVEVALDKVGDVP